MHTVIDAIQKENAIDQQQHSCETLICQRHQTIPRLLSSAATQGHDVEFANFIVISRMIPGGFTSSLLRI